MFRWALIGFLKWAVRMIRRDFDLRRLSAVAFTPYPSQDFANVSKSVLAAQSLSKNLQIITARSLQRGDARMIPKILKCVCSKVSLI